MQQWLKDDGNGVGGGSGDGDDDCIIGNDDDEHDDKNWMVDLCQQEVGGTGKCNWSVAFTLFYSLLHILSTRSKRLIGNYFWSADDDNDERTFTMY